MVSIEEGRTSWDLNYFCQYAVKLCSYGFFLLNPTRHWGFLMFALRRHGVAKMFLYDEGCEF